MENYIYVENDLLESRLKLIAQLLEDFNKRYPKKAMQRTIYAEKIAKCKNPYCDGRSCNKH